MPIDEMMREVIVVKKANEVKEVKEVIKIKAVEGDTKEEVMIE